MADIKFCGKGIKRWEVKAISFQRGKFSVQGTKCNGIKFPRWMNFVMK